MLLNRNWCNLEGTSVIYGGPSSFFLGHSKDFCVNITVEITRFKDIDFKRIFQYIGDK